MLTATSEETYETAPVRTEPEPDVEALLWRRAGIGLIWGALAVALMGYVLLTLIQPDEPVLARLGLAAFLGFWSSPFVGLSGAVGYHELAKRKTRSTEPVRHGETGAMRLSPQ